MEILRMTADIYMKWIGLIQKSFAVYKRFLHLNWCKELTHHLTTIPLPPNECVKVTPFIK